MFASPRAAWVFGAAFVAMSAMSSAAGAQTPPMDAETAQKFAGFATSAAYFHFLQERLPQLEPAPLLATCSDIKPVQRKRLVIMAPPVFGPDGQQPMRGAWIDQIQVSRCGSDALRSLLISVKDSSMQLAALLPGSTDATPVLQRDALPAAEIQAKQAAKCQTKMVVIDTVIEGELKPGAPWNEVWTFHGCDNATAKVAMAFVPDGKGGTNYVASRK